jgi:hypothetical protein
VLGKRVEAEERLAAVEQVQHERRRAAVHPDFRAGGADEAEVGQLGHGLSEGVGVAAADLLCPLTERGLVGQVFGPAREGPRPVGVGHQDAQGDAFGPELADPDFAQRFLHDAVEGLPGEPGEVNRHLGLLECPLDVWAQGDGAGPWTRPHTR